MRRRWSCWVSQPEYGVSAAGLYVVDDYELRPLAGPFISETGALAWIVERQESRRHATATLGVRRALTVQSAIA